MSSSRFLTTTEGIKAVHFLMWLHGMLGVNHTSEAGIHVVLATTIREALLQKKTSFLLRLLWHAGVICGLV